jgi:hypothetical protein
LRGLAWVALSKNGVSTDGVAFPQPASGLELRTTCRECCAGTVMNVHLRSVDGARPSQQDPAERQLGANGDPRSRERLLDTASCSCSKSALLRSHRTASQKPWRSRLEHRAPRLSGHRSTPAASSPSPTLRALGAVAFSLPTSAFTQGLAISASAANTFCPPSLALTAKTKHTT